MDKTFYILLIFSILLALNIFLKFFKANIKSKERPKPRKLLTKAEYKMYFVLLEALPEHKILVQVSFAAMLRAENISVVNTFLAKRADYVICDNALNVVLVLELDDWSHKGREKEDKARDRLLTNAGYKVLHLKTIPTVEEMKNIFLEATDSKE